MILTLGHDCKKKNKGQKYKFTPHDFNHKEKKRNDRVCHTELLRARDLSFIIERVIIQMPFVELSLSSIICITFCSV